MDSSGNLYGTTYGCGANNEGMVWQLSRGGTETILYQFDGVNTGETYAGVVRSRARTNPVGSLRAAAPPHWIQLEVIPCKETYVG
jgi:uncharacterized repeat protein (TIGR03803 family)